MILYFTGTGNSRYCAQIIGAILGEEPVSMTEIMRQRISKTQDAQLAFESETPYVFVCPTYCWRMPRVVENFIRNSSFSGNKKAYFFLTCGESTGNAHIPAKKLCGEVGFEYMGMLSAPMPENYIAMFDSPDHDEALMKIRTAHPIAESAARLILASRPFGHDPQSEKSRLGTMINGAFYKTCVSDKGFKAGDSCIGCGKCASLCPLCNISIKDNKPQWNGKCTQCMACISICPVNAIEYGRKTNGKRRYYLYADGTQKK